MNHGSTVGLNTAGQGRSGRQVPESGPIVLDLSFVVRDPDAADRRVRTERPFPKEGRPSRRSGTFLQAALLKMLDCLNMDPMMLRPLEYRKGGSRKARVAERANRDAD